jgi:hypothetical protein
VSGGELGWVVNGVDLERPNPARIYDYLLGGHHNFEADRAAAEKLIARLPYAREGAVAQRAFLRRAIGLFTAEGVEQFLDIGSGLPTVGNVHELARAEIPEARVAYVDIDPVVVAQGSQLLKDDPGATIIEADVRYPASILEHPEVRQLLDFSRPVALTITSVLHFVTDDELAYGAVRALKDALALGSYMAISHGLLLESRREVVGKVLDEYKPAGNVKARRREDIARFFDGFDLVEPGLVRPPLWRPEGPDDVLLDRPGTSNALAGVGMKP